MFFPKRPLCFGKRRYFFLVAFYLKYHKVRTEHQHGKIPFIKARHHHVMDALTVVFLRELAIFIALEVKAFCRLALKPCLFADNGAVDVCQSKRIAAVMYDMVFTPDALSRLLLKAFRNVLLKISSLPHRLSIRLRFGQAELIGVHVECALIRVHAENRTGVRAAYALFPRFEPFLARHALCVCFSYHMRFSLLCIGHSLHRRRTRLCR